MGSRKEKEAIEEKKQRILEICKQKDVKFIRMQFVDLLGFLKSFAIPIEELEHAMDDGMGFDGSSITGYVPIEESDMVAKPDLDTFAIIPWRPKEKAVARFICDIYTPEGKPFEGDPRYILKRNLEYAREKGFIYNVGTECEYYYFKTPEKPEPLDIGGYFDLLPLDVAEDLRRETIFALEELGLRVEYSHHEVGPSQHEIDFRYSDALTIADAVMTYKWAVKAIARKFGVYATFMPKPLFGENGSGMHTHQSLADVKTGKNVFFSADDPEGYHLSDIAKGFIAGQLKYAREICGIVAQWVNSYKRLVPGYEAPVYIAWARRNRSALIRVPEYHPGKEQATRAEFRAPDPACNPYLAFSVMLRAGLQGIEEYKRGELEFPAPVERNLYTMSEQERRELGIKQLPATLGEAIEEVENSELVREALGDHAYFRWLEIKKEEWFEYNVHVHEWEIRRYLPYL